MARSTAIRLQKCWLRKLFEPRDFTQSKTTVCTDLGLGECGCRHHRVRTHPMVTKTGFKRLKSNWRRIKYQKLSLTCLAISAPHTTQRQSRSIHTCNLDTCGSTKSRLMTTVSRARLRHRKVKIVLVGEEFRTQHANRAPHQSTLFFIGPRARANAFLETIVSRCGGVAFNTYSR